MQRWGTHEQIWSEMHSTRGLGHWSGCRMGLWVRKAGDRVRKGPCCRVSKNSYGLVLFPKLVYKARYGTNNTLTFIECQPKLSNANVVPMALRKACQRAGWSAADSVQRILENAWCDTFSNENGWNGWYILNDSMWSDLRQSLVFAVEDSSFLPVCLCWHGAVGHLGSLREISPAHKWIHVVHGKGAFGDAKIFHTGISVTKEARTQSTVQLLRGDWLQQYEFLRGDSPPFKWLPCFFPRLNGCVFLTKRVNT